MIGRALDAGVPFAWFVADEELGRTPACANSLKNTRSPM